MRISRHTGWFGWAALTLLTVFALPLHGEPLKTHQITAQHQANLADKTLWMTENGEALDAATIAREPEGFEWQGIDADVLNLGLQAEPIWLGIRLETPRDIRRYLTIDYPPLDRVSFHLFQDGMRIDSIRTGDELPFRERPIPYHNFAFPLELEADASYLLLIRVQTQGALQVPLTIWTPEAFIGASESSTALQMMFIGIMATLCLYNLLVWIAVRDAAYLWYVLYLASFLLGQAALRGVGFQYFWPEVPGFNAMSVPLFFSLSLATAAFFAHRFLDVPKHSRFWSRLMRTVGTVGVLLAVLSLILSYHIIIGIMIIAVGIGSILIFLGGCYLWWRGEVLARFYVIAWGIFLAAQVIYSTSKLGLLPTTTLIEHSPQTGAILQMLLLSFALAWRINQERERRQQAQAEALAAQREANEQLEARVDERTEELRDAYDKLKKMSELDGLTQLKNRPYFDQALEREWRRNSREVQTMSLLMIDIDYFKTVNDTLGHQCGDAALRHIADICRENVGRAADVVARYGGEEFVILLPITTLQGAAYIAERIRKDTESQAFYWEGERVHLTLSIGVSGCVPSQKRDYEWLVRHADEALYDAKHQGRNWTRVTVEHDDGRIETVDAASLFRADNDN